MKCTEHREVGVMLAKVNPLPTAGSDAVGMLQGSKLDEAFRT